MSQELPASGDKMSRRELLMLAQPLGYLDLDGSLCTGCGLCVSRCSTGAIEGTAEADDSYRLIFRHGSCVACGECVSVCPEKCLHLKRMLEPDKLSTPVVLFQGRLARCSKCGRVIGTREMLERIKERIQAASLPDLCPECKVASFHTRRAEGK